MRKAIADAEGYLVCSICARRFEPGDVVLGQCRVTMERYSSRYDWRSDPPIYFMPVNQNNFEFLSHFHERCLL